jgi:hypothetical protein
MDAPKVFTLGAAPVITDFLAYLSGTGHVTVYWKTFIADVPDSPTSQDRILVYLSGPFSRSVKPVKIVPRRRTFKSVLGPGSQPQSHSAAETSYTWPDSDYVFIRIGCRYSRADGRLSSMTVADAPTS